jgi:hypothetical protein
MKYAVPPMAAAARMPTTMTEAMRTETHVFRVFWLMVLLL